MRTIHVLGRRLYNRHLKNGLPSCLNHCAWPRALPEPVSPSVCFVSTLPLNNPRDGLCFNVLNKGVQESWNADLPLLFHFVVKEMKLGPGSGSVTVFIENSGASFVVFLEPCQESNYSLLKNCNAAQVWWCDDGCRCVSQVKKTLLDVHLMDKSNKCQICICC